MISIHALLAESDVSGNYNQTVNGISIHALLAESDFPTVSSLPRAASFLSTLSLRRATYDLHGLKMGYCISIHALLAESDLKFTRLFYDLFISIHALLAESDVLEEDFPVDSVTISIHALLAESDQAGIADVTQRLISIHALLAESDVGDTPPCCGCMISIHALLAESDCWCWEPGTVTARFLSTLSLRRATAHFAQQIHAVGISIHALLAESDVQRGPRPHQGRHFYPRSPCGERHGGRFLPKRGHRFLSTLSLRRATVLVCPPSVQPDYFYPRSPCGERPTVDCNLSRRLNFYPRSPCGERRFPVSAHCFDGRFLSTLSLRRATQTRFTRSSRIFISIHALLAESDAFRSPRIALMVGFLSTLSLRRATTCSAYVKP